MSPSGLEELSGPRAWLAHIVWLCSAEWAVYLVVTNEPHDVLIYTILSILAACVIGLVIGRTEPPPAGEPADLTRNPNLSPSPSWESSAYE